MAMVCFSSAATAQFAADADLGKYSYPIFALAGKSQHTGTAFFYRAHDSIFLVSNYHAIKGMSPLKQSIAFEADTIYLEYPTVNDGGKKLLPVDVSEQVLGKTEVFSMVDRIDLLKVPVELPPDADISFINDMIDPAYMNEEPEEVIAFGYPQEAGALPVFFSRQQSLRGRVNPAGFAEYDSSIRRQHPRASEQAISIVTGTSRYYYFIRPYAAQGYSGAPVFGKYRTTSNEVVYKFAGVIFGGQPSTKQTWTIKPEVALEYLGTVARNPESSGAE